MILDRDDRRGLGLLMLSFLLGIACSWERWGSPLVDCGREMQAPLRILQGERLYADISYFYGPFSPYLHWGLYRLFGPSLDVLRIDGMISALLIIGLIYAIARQVMDSTAATMAAFGVTWLCAFKQAGNYILPYAYPAVHGCLFGLAAFLFIVRALQTGRRRWVSLAGLLTGLAFLSKLEMGCAALVGCWMALLLADRVPDRKRAFALAVYSCLAAGLPLAGYALIARQVGWDVLLSEGYLLLYNIPAELVYYNRRMFGFDHPWRSLAAMAIVTLRLLTLAALIAALSSWIQRPSGMPLWKACSMRVAAVLLGATLLTHRLADWETGPYYAMPFLLLGVIVALLWRRWRERDPGDSLQWVIVLALSTYALASLARTLLRVRTGGAYSSYLLPPSIIVFTYLWEQGRPALSAMPVRTLSRRIGRGVLILWLVSAAIVTCVRYRANFTYPLSSPRGTMIVKPDLGVVFQKARAFVEERTQPGDPVAIFPEGTALLFLSDRRNPIHEEITTPGFLNEQRAVQRLIAARTRLILIANRPTTEFGAQAFGRDYGQFLMRWVEGRYAVCGFFAAKPRATATIDYGPFFIQAYCPKPATEPFAEGPHAR